MEVISYRKEKENFITPTFGYNDECFYIVDKGMILYKHSPVMAWSQKPEYVASKSLELLEEARQILGNNLSKKYGLNFSQIKAFYYNDSELQAMLEKKESGEKILRRGIEALIKHAEKVSHGKRK